MAVLWRRCCSAFADYNATSSALVGQDRMHEVSAVHSSQLRQLCGERIGTSTESLEQFNQLSTYEPLTFERKVKTIAALTSDSSNVASMKSTFPNFTKNMRR
jgi:hypothetical protein